MANLLNMIDACQRAHWHLPYMDIHHIQSTLEAVATSLTFTVLERTFLRHGGAQAGGLSFRESTLHHCLGLDNPHCPEIDIVVSNKGFRSMQISKYHWAEGGGRKTTQTVDEEDEDRSGKHLARSVIC